MSKITSFTKGTDFKAIRNDINDALKAVGDKYGMDLSIGNIRFEGSKFSTKLEAILQSTTGESRKPWEVDLDNYATSFLGFDFDKNKIYDYGSKKIKIVGILPKKRKAPIVFKYINEDSLRVMSEDNARTVIKANKIAA